MKMKILSLVFFAVISSMLVSAQNNRLTVKEKSEGWTLLFDGKNFDYVPSHYVTAVDTTAAGDAFTAALTVEYLRTKNIKTACKYANIVGALTVTKFGAMPSLPTTREVDDFIVAKKIKV